MYFFYFVERLRYLLDEMYEKVEVGEPMEEDPNENKEGEDPNENEEEEDPSEDEEKEDPGQVLEAFVVNEPPEFEYISSDDKEDLAEVQNDFERPTLESDDEANVWIWKSTDPK